MNLKKGACYIVFFQSYNKFDIWYKLVSFAQKFQVGEYTKFYHTGFAFWNGREYIIRECRLTQNGLCLYNLHQRVGFYNGKVEIYEIDNLKNGSKKILKDYDNNKVKYGILNAIASITFKSKSKIIKYLDKMLDRLPLDKNKSFCSKDTSYCFQLINKDKQHQLEILIKNKGGIDEITPQDLYNYCKNYCVKVY